MISLLLMLMMTHSAAKPPPEAKAPVVRSDAELREVIESYLDASERPMPDAQWQALGQQAEPILREIVSGNGLPTRRARAVNGLVALAGQSTPAMLAEFSLDEAKPLSVRLAAVRGLSRLTADGELLTVLRPVVESAKDPRVSSTAAELIARRVPESGCTLVRAKGASDLHFQRALNACDGR
jgi:HEAT repeat protein